MRTPLAVLRLLLAASAASVPGASARAVPLSLSATEVTWTTETAGNVRSTLTLRLDDMAHPDPGVGQIHLSIAGRVEQPNYRHRYLEVVGMEIYGDRGTSSLRAELLDAVFSHPLASAATGSPTIAGPGTPTYTWVDFRTAAPAGRSTGPRRQCSRSSTWETCRRASTSSAITCRCDASVASGATGASSRRDISTWR